MTAEEYEALPEDISKTIEIVDGQVIYCDSPTPEHQRACRRLANLLEGHARAAMRSGHDRLAVDIDVDLRLRDLPLLNRRPDVILYRCLDRENKERLTGEHALLVVEVVSPGSETQDTNDKFTEYARAGIPHYWIVRLDSAGVSVIERYQLDKAAMLFKHVNTLMKDEAGAPPEVGNPIPITVTWDDLEF
ncbi:Uma2 family endonuclease [Actinomadura barringtoniae]|uniref:Uma2 family endonuclease n=1 Tax=Actinomadura barringtoniae TaxID=1427535 RepID=A0A939PD14_9ACTN|nr:Uma2 family endonuclease [Actinomadura barringtoniae]MBO2450597.1 Uma2 family endonuclease [Actinomadura barringtoniae]